MSQIHVEVSQVINAPPSQVYAVLSDYHVSHPAILPKPYFSDLVVEKGGKGAGTVIRVDMNVMGAKRSFHLAVTEPEPGRVLAEVDVNGYVATTFTIEPLNGGEKSRVTIASDSKASPGFKGIMEKLMNPPITRHIYRKEFEQLAEYVRNASQAA